MMRALIVAAAFILSGCALSNSDVSVPAATYVAPSPPSPQAQLKGVAAAAKEEKLAAGDLEISDPQSSNFGPGRWMICMRGTRDSKPTYFSVFFDNEDYKTVRLSIISEDCARQSYRPTGLLPDSAQADGAKPPDQKQEKKKKRRRSSTDNQ